MKKEQWEIDYSERVKAIQEAIREGHKFYLTTYIGKLLVNWFDESNAHTGEGFHARTWAICSTHVFKWAAEIGIPKDHHFDDPEETFAECGQCGNPMNPAEVMLGPICGGCVRKNHLLAIGRKQ